MKLADIALTSQSLTREEKLQVTSMVLETSNYTIAEARTNQTIKEEIKLNLEFYTEVKKGFLNEAGGAIGAILSVLGNIKDFLTGAKVVKDIVAFVKGLIDKLTEKLSPLVDKYVPANLQNIVKQTGQAIEFEISFWQDFTKVIYKTLSPAGLAKLFAMIKYKTVRPSEEQKKCMLAVATAVYRAIIITLIAAFLIKLGMALVAVATAKGLAGAAVGTGIQKAAMFSYLQPVIAKVGGGSVLKGMFGTFSAGIKAKDAKKLKQQLEAEKTQEIQGNIIQQLKQLWNQCSVK